MCKGVINNLSHVMRKGGVVFNNFQLMWNCGRIDREKITPDFLNRVETRRLLPT